MTLKEKIRSKKKMVGMHINLNDIATAKIAAVAGYDYIWVDLEHSYLSLENLLSYIITIKASGTAVIVRVPMDDFTYAKKVMEMGPDGIIFPMVRNAEHAKRLIDYTLYPPYGNRGFGPMNAVDYGVSSVADFAANTLDNICRFIQLELKEAIDNLDEIMKNEYIDGYIFGPWDLSGSIGELGRVYDENTTKLIRYATEKLHENGKYVGLSTGDMSIEGIKHWYDMGIDMLSAGADYDFLRVQALENCKNLKRIFSPETICEEKVFYST